MRVDPRRRARPNLLNGSTLLGLALARVARGRPVRGADLLWLVEGHQLPVRAAFTVGDVVLHPRPGGLVCRDALLRQSANPFATWAGLADGGYPGRPARG